MCVLSPGAGRQNPETEEKDKSALFIGVYTFEVKGLHFCPMVYRSLCLGMFRVLQAGVKQEQC